MVNNGVYQFEIINVLASASRFIWIPMLWVYDQYKYFNYFCFFIRQNLTSTEFRFWRIKKLKGWNWSLWLSKYIQMVKVVIFVPLTLSPLNPLSPHDALKHHITSLKTDSIFLQLGVLERKFPWNWFTNTQQISSIFKPHQVILIHYKSKIATAIRGL